MTDQLNLLLNDGHSMPRLGLGVYKIDDDAAVSIIAPAIAAGYRSIDTAALYGNEKGVGDAVRAASVPRENLFITTKLWNDDHGYDQAFRGLERSLARLGFDAVDLYLIHWPQPERNLYVETWRALIKMQAQGLAKSIGVSNFTEQHLRRLIDETGVTPSVNQVELHLGFQQKALRAFHAEHAIATESWGPLGRGSSLAHPALAPLVQKYGKSAAQVVIRWHLQSGLVVIPKSATPSRIVENADIHDFQIDAADMKILDAMDDPGGRFGPDPTTFG